MNRIAGIVFAAAGLLIAVLSIAKVVPGLTQAGVVMIVAGGLMIGLSFIDRPLSDGEQRMSTPATFANIFLSPGETFRNFRRHPRWLAAVLVMVALSATYNNLFLQRLGTDRVTNFAIDKTLEMPMIANSDDARAQVEKGRAQALADAKNPVMRAGQLVSSFAGMLFLFSFLALIYFLFALAMGGKINFWQAFAVAVYASLPVAIIRFALNTIVLYLKDPIEIHPILGQQSLIQDNLSFLVTSTEHPVIYTLLAAFSLLGFYWLFLNAIGLKNAGEKVTGTAAWSATIAVFAAGVFLSLLAAMLFPSFIS
jgi:hypothetical protein